MSMADGSGGSTPQRHSGDESDSDYENEHIRPRGLTGLQNLGNTCYLNSAVQSLSNCPPLTQYFLDCAPLIRPDKPPMLSKNYLKLMTELWHKKRPSYVVPSGVVAGIKAVHPMFRGYTQQDAQEFLRCLMDQLHEELKVASGDDDSEDSDTDSEDEESTIRADDTNNGNSAGQLGDEVVDYQHKTSASPESLRRKSFDSASSHSSELDYETCDSGLSSERSYPGDRESSDESNCDSDLTKLQADDRHRSISTGTLGEGNNLVANTKEMKETANLLEKQHESEGFNRRSRGRVLEGGDSADTGTGRTSVSTKDGEMQTVNVEPRAVSPHRDQSTHTMHLPKSPKKQPKKKNPLNMKYDSIISQTFDGKILSSVRCLNCETVSTTKETFQDLSLPIPSKDHLHMLHSGHHPGAGGVTPPKGGTCGEVHQGWFSWMYTWMKSWFTGPTITLQDCLSAFFSADELKGDNMYSCEKCKKLRNGLKYSKVLELPEILSVHLKRFRHEFYSSKISTYISFPLEGLDMQPYLHKACKNEVQHYELVAIICHHGTAGGGHYTAYCLNHLNGQWYEFDDQYVTEVDVSQVMNCEAYVLFYRKSNRKMESLRQRIEEVEQNECSILKFHLSKQWVSKFHTFAEPGPITNSDFLCKHGGVPPGKVALIDDLFVEIQQSTWEILHDRFGGGPVCNHLYACKTCHSEQEKLRLRQRSEKETFIQLNDEFQEEDNLAVVYAISMSWFKEWETFVREKTDNPPGPIDNSRIIVHKNGQPTLRPSSDHGQLSPDMWLFLHQIYGGGPELQIRQSTGASVKAPGSSPTPSQPPAASPPAASSPTSQGNVSPAVPSAPATASVSSTAPAVSPVQPSVSTAPASTPAAVTRSAPAVSPSQPSVSTTPAVTTREDSPVRPSLHHSQARTQLNKSPSNQSLTTSSDNSRKSQGGKESETKSQTTSPAQAVGSEFDGANCAVSSVSEAGDKEDVSDDSQTQTLSEKTVTGGTGEKDSQGDVKDDELNVSTKNVDTKIQAHVSPYGRSIDNSVSPCGDSKLVEKLTAGAINTPIPVPKQDDQEKEFSATTDAVGTDNVGCSEEVKSNTDVISTESGYGSRLNLASADTNESCVAKPTGKRDKNQRNKKKGKQMETTRI